MRKPIETQVSKDEALKINKYTTIQPMLIAYELYEAYKTDRPLNYPFKIIEKHEKCELMELLSFIYNTGRVQGIREERRSKHG